MSAADPLLGPIEGARHEVFGRVDVDVVAAGGGRVKRLVYPPGSRWSEDRKPLVGTEYCMHAHVGFLARGRLDGVFDDGCTYSFTAPEVVVLEPGGGGNRPARPGTRLGSIGGRRRGVTWPRAPWRQSQDFQNRTSAFNREAPLRFAP